MLQIVLDFPKIFLWKIFLLELRFHRYFRWTKRNKTYIKKEKCGNISVHSKKYQIPIKRSLSLVSNDSFVWESVCTGRTVVVVVFYLLLFTKKNWLESFLLVSDYTVHTCVWQSDCTGPAVCFWLTKKSRLKRLIRSTIKLQPK